MRSDKIARYHRVSTERQTLKRQADSTDEYIADRWPDAETEAFADASTGTDTDRSGYQKLMDRADAGEFDAVVVHEISRISRSMMDLNRTVERLKDSDTSLHIISEGLVVDPDATDPFDKAILQILGVVAELESNMIGQRIKEGIAAKAESGEYVHGPAPLGFKKSDGELIQAEDYDRVVAVLEMVRKGELSKRQASKELDCGRGTIYRALENIERYGLKGDGGATITARDDE